MPIKLIKKKKKKKKKFYALSKPIHNKMSKTSFVHRNLHRHHYVVKKNGVENFGKQSTSPNEKVK